MTQAITDKKPPYLLMYIVTLVYLVVTAFFEEGVAYFDPVYTTLMSSTEFYLTFSLCVVLFLTEIYIAKHYFGIRINWVFFSLIALLFLIDVVAILSFPEWTVLTGVYHVTVSLRLRYITFWLAACMAFYVFFAIMPKSVRNIRSWNFYYLGGIVISFSAVVYSLIFEKEVYIGIFTKEYLWNLYPELVSFTNNRNTFGVLLFIGVVCSTMLAVFSSKKIWYLLSLFFIADLLVVASRTSIVCTAVFLLFFFVWFFAKSIRGKKIGKIIISSLIVLGILSIIVAAFLRLGRSNSVISHIYAYLDSITTSDNSGILYSLSNRVESWQLDLSVFAANPLALIFGLGDWNFSWFLGFASSGSTIYIESSHSGLFDVLCRFGLLGLLVYFCLIAYFFVCFSKIIKNKIYGSTLYLGVFLCVLCHGVFEDTNFLNMQAKDMMFLFLAYMPVMTNCHLIDNNSDASAWTKEYADCVKRSSRSDKRNFLAVQSLMFILCVSLSMVVGLADFYSIWGSAGAFNSVFSQLQISLVFIVCSVFAYFLKNKREKTRGFHRISLSISAAVWLICCFAFCVFYHNIWSFIFLLISALLISAICLWFSDGKYTLKFLLDFSAYLALMVFLIAFNKFTVLILLTSDEIFQPYAAMCLYIFDFIFPFMITFASPVHGKIFDSIDGKWNSIEDSYRFIGYRYQVKYEIRLMKATQRKPILRCQK